MARSRASENKLKQLILHVARQCEEDILFGAIKLNKVLFFADFEAYEKTGKPITGVEYRKYEFGPAPGCMKRVKDEMKKKGLVYEGKNARHQKRIYAIRDPDLRPFTRDQIAIVGRAIERVRNMSALGVSDLSHEFPGWKLAEYGEEIPYFTALIASPEDMEISGEERAWVERVAARIAKTQAAAA